MRSSDNSLIDIIHPYWTPRDYWGGALTLEWRHDISELMFCGTDMHYYDIRVSFGTDTEDNPSCAVEAEWRYEFKKHWMMQVKGLVQFSEEWDASGVWAKLQYQF